MNRILQMGLTAALLAGAGAGVAADKPRTSPARPGELMLFEQTNFNGDHYTVEKDNPYIYTDWNVRSIAIYPGEKWQICNKSKYKGDCLTLTDSFTDSSTIGVMGQVPSARRAPATP